MPQAITEEVRRLLRRHLPTLAHVDVLVALVRSTPDANSSADIARHSHLDAATAEGYLNALIQAGLASAEGSGDARRFTFAPRSAIEGDAARQLTDLMSRRPVTLERHVYERKEPPEASLE